MALLMWVRQQEGAFTDYLVVGLFYIREGKPLDDKTNFAFSTNFFANFHFFVSFPRAHARTLKNHSISPHANTVQNNAVESSTKFYCNLMLFINWVYEM
jgi:hypothetical protein